MCPRRSEIRRILLSEKNARLVLVTFSRQQYSAEFEGAERDTMVLMGL